MTDTCLKHFVALLWQIQFGNSSGSSLQPVRNRFVSPCAAKIKCFIDNELGNLELCFTRRKSQVQVLYRPVPNSFGSTFVGAIKEDFSLSLLLLSAMFCLTLL